MMPSLARLFPCRFFSLALLIFLLPGSALSGAERFVAPDGDDTLAGDSPATAWRTVQKAVDLLEPGDTLTLLPGEYRQQLVIDKEATAERPIVIRAARRGFSVLSGWERVERFERVKGSRFVYRRKIRTPVYRLVERDTGAMLLQAPSLVDMDRFRGSFLVDEATGMLHVHTSDGQSPDAHVMMATVRSGNGIILKGAHVILDGLAVNGFSPVSHEGTGHGFGIRVEGHHQTVRHGFFLANGGAVTVQRGEDCLIEGNRMVANIDPGYNELAQIYCSSRSRRTRVLNNIVLDGQTHGIRFYGRATDCTAIGNLVKNSRIGLYFKASGGMRLARRNVVVGGSFVNWHSGEGADPMVEDENTFQRTSFWQADRQLEPGKRTLLFSDEAEEHFCAPQHLDYRLQADSPARGGGAGGGDLGALPYAGDVFFVSPKGSDEAEGGSVARAFRTVQRALREAGPGVTIYLLPGSYEAPPSLSLQGTEQQPIFLRSRDPQQPATLRPSKKGSLGLNLSGACWLKVEAVAVEGGVGIHDSREITLERCRIVQSPAAALSIKGSEGIWLRQSILRDTAEGVRIDGASRRVSITSSILSARKGPLINASELPGREWFGEYNFYAASGRQPVGRLKEGRGATLKEWAAVSGHDRYSLEGDPGFAKGKPWALASSSPCVGAGELGDHIGGATVSVPARPPVIAEVTLREATPTSASFSWWTPNTSFFGIRSPQQWSAPLPVSSELRFGTEPDQLETVHSFGDVRHQVSLRGLKPGTTYYYKIVIPEKPGSDDFRNGYSYQKTAPEGWAGAETKLATFTTPSRKEWKPSARTIHVSPQGKPGAGGATPDDPTTLTEAGDRVLAGDTVLMHDGIYQEAFTPVATGVPGAPITLRALHRGKAIIDGSSYTRPSAVALSWKDRMIIDGPVIRRFTGLTYGSRAGLIDAQIFLARCGAIEVRNSVLIGYGFYTKAVTARNVGRLTFTNNAVFGFPSAIVGVVDEGAYLDGNTWYVTWIRSSVLEGPVFLKNNLFFGQNPQKVGGPITPMVTIYRPVASDYNAYYFGPKNAKGYIGFGLESSEENPARVERVRRELGLDLHSLEPTQDEMQFAGPLLIDYFDHKERNALQSAITNAELLPTLEWFALPEGNRLNHAGEGGRPIGARPVAASEKE
ncbi:MAG TPA: right-handed parallel beta-helix repeat-containing protein [Chthoniobacteraceae bacterium]|nr:right-handed parallel beta-helix repeat-containing protein [Chthoniobacteraceae bacterium]